MFSALGIGVVRVLNHNIGGWNVARVSTMSDSQMFDGCGMSGCNAMAVYVRWGSAAQARFRTF